MPQLPGGSPIVPSLAEVILPALSLMGDRSPKSATRTGARWRLFGPPSRLLLLQGVLLLACLIATPAMAEPIPMCGELAQSIEAPPPIYPSADAAWLQTPCSPLTPLAYWDEAPVPSPPDEPRTLNDPLGYLRGEKLPRASSIRLPLARGETLRPPTGTRREVERPPRLVLGRLR